MRRCLLAGAVAAAAILVSACSKSHSAADRSTVVSSPTSVTTTSATPASTSSGSSTALAARDYASPDAVIAALAAKGVVCASPAAQQVTEEDRAYPEKATECTIGTERVAVAWFSSAAQRGTYQQIGARGGGAYPHFVLGTTWAVATLTSDTAQEIAAAIGGKIY
jgi:hypothetical protein